MIIHVEDSAEEQVTVTIDDRGVITHACHVYANEDHKDIYKYIHFFQPQMPFEDLLDIAVDYVKYFGKLESRIYLFNIVSLRYFKKKIEILASEHPEDEKLLPTFRLLNKAITETRDEHGEFHSKKIDELLKKHNKIKDMHEIKQSDLPLSVQDYLIFKLGIEEIVN